MPIYKLNGESYDIPENVVSEFEKDNPAATVTYRVGSDEYDIPVSERAAFLKDFPDAQVDGANLAAEQKGTETDTKNGEDNKLTQEDLAGFQRTIQQAQQAVRGSKRAAGRIEAIQHHAKKTNFGLTPQQVMLGENRKVIETAPQFNVETGKLESTYLTEHGNEYSSRAGADLEENLTDIAKYKESLPGQLEDAYAERERLKAELGEEQGPAGVRKGFGTMLYQSGKGAPVETRDDYEKKKAALRQVEKRINTLEAERDNAGFWSALATDLGVPESWAFGIAELADAGKLLGIKNKLYRAKKEGLQPELTDAEQLLLRETLLANAAEQEFGDNRSAWYRAGKMGAQSIQMIPDFIIGMGPMKSIATATIKGFTKAGTRVLGEELATKLIPKAIVKTTGMTVGTLAGGTVMVNTIQAPKLAAETIKNMTGELTINDKGEYVFGTYKRGDDGKVQFVEETDSFIPSLLKAEQKLIPEASSEALGEFLPGVGQVLNKLGLSKITGQLSRLTGSGWYRSYSDILRRTGFHGVPGEMVEEYANDVHSLILGDPVGIFGNDEGKGGWADPQKHLDIALGCATLGAILNAPRIAGTAYQAAQYARYKHNVDKADARAAGVWGDNWQATKESIDECDNENMAKMANTILSGNLSTEQKRSAWDYLYNLQKMRGYSLGAISQNAEGQEDTELNEEIARLEQSYTEGHEVEESDEKKTIVDEANAAEARLVELFSEEDVQWIAGMEPTTAINVMLENRGEEQGQWRDEKIAAVVDYYQKQARAQGVMDAAADDVEIQVTKANAEVDANTHTLGQMIEVISEGESFYLVGGDVSLLYDTEQGKYIFAYENTGDALIVRNAQTGEISVKSPMQLSVINVTDPNILKQQNETQLRQDVTQQHEDEMTFGSPAQEVFQLNDTVVLNDGQGNTIEGEIGMMPTSVDGTYVVYTADGKALQFTADDLNKMVVAHNGVEVERAAAKTHPTEQAEGAQSSTDNVQAEQEQPQSAIDKIPFLQDEKGNPILNKKGKKQYQWHKATVEDTADALTETTGGDMVMARDTATDLVNQEKGKLEKIRKQKPKGDDPIEIAESRAEIRRLEQEQQAIIKHWQDVNQAIQNRMRAATAQREAERRAALTEEQRAQEDERKRQEQERQEKIANERRKQQIEEDLRNWNKPYQPLEQAKREMAGDADAMSILSDTEPQSLDEWVSSLLRPQSMMWNDEVVNGRTITGLQSELGLSWSDMQRFGGLIGGKGKGKPFGQVVHEIWEGLPEGMRNQHDDQDVRNVLLSLFNESDSKRMRNLAAEHRIEQAREIMKENQLREAEYEMEAWAEAYHLTPEERESFEEFLQQSPIEPEQAVIDQIIAEHEQNRTSPSVDGKPVSGRVEAGVEGSQEQVRKESEAAGDGVYEEAVAEGTEAGGSESSVADNPVAGGAQGVTTAADATGTVAQREELAALFDQIGAEPVLAERMSDYEVEQLAALVEDWDAINSDYGEVIESQNEALKSKNKAVRDAAQAAVNEAQAKSNEAFEPVEQYVAELQAKYITAEGEDFDGAIPNPKIDAPRYMANRQTLIDAYRSGDAAAITQAAQAVQQYVDEGLDSVGDHTEIFDMAEEYDGNDPEMLADQYIIRTYWDRFLDDDVDQEYIRTGLKPSMRNAAMESPRKETEQEEDPLAAAVTAARNGNIEAQKQLEKYGIKWEKKPVVRFVAQGEVDNILKGGRYEGRFGDGRVDVTNSTDVTTAATADYRITFNDELDWTLNDRLRMKNEELGDGYIMDGYSLDDVATIEKRNPDGTYTIIYNQKYNNTNKNERTELETQSRGADSGTEMDHVDTGNKDAVRNAEGKGTLQETQVDSRRNGESDNGQQGVHLSASVENAVNGIPDRGVSVQTEREGIVNSIGTTSSPEQISQEESKVDTNPSEAQKEAGNYQKGHIKIDGYDITIENPKGSVRRGTDANGAAWETEMHNTYGYIRGTEGVDGDHIDVFLSDNPSSGQVFVVDQVNSDGSFDEHKVMYGFASEQEAREAYLSNYSEGWQGLGYITEVSREDFKKWVESSHRKTKPFAEYKAVKEAHNKEVVNTLTSLSADYHSAPIAYAELDMPDEVFVKALGVPQHVIDNFESIHDCAEALRKEFKESKTYAFFNKESGEIVTFASAVPLNRVREMFFHENVHAILHSWYGDNAKGIAEKFWDAAPAEGDRVKKDFIQRKYNEEDWKEEFFVTWIGNAMAEGSVHELEQYLTDPADIQRLHNILDNIGYEREERTAVASETLRSRNTEERRPGRGQQQPQGGRSGQGKVTSSGNKLVTDERYEQLKERMKKKLLGQMNMGIDPEILAIGTEMAVYHIEKGARQFVEYAKRMIDDLGDAIRPYLKAFYNGARDLPEMAELSQTMDAYEDVSKFDVFNFDKRQSPTPVEKAQQVVSEKKAEREAKEATEKIKEIASKGSSKKGGKKQQAQVPSLFDLFEEPAGKPQGTVAEPDTQVTGTERKAERKLRPATEADMDAPNPIVYYQGKPYNVISVVRYGEQVSATQFSKPKLGSIMLSNGKSVQLSELEVEDDETVEKRKTAWWSDANRPQSLDPRDYTTYTTDEAKDYFAQFKSADGKVDFTKWAHPNLAYITAAAWDGAVIPKKELVSIKEIQEAEVRIMSKAGHSLNINEQEQLQHVEHLLDAEHGSAVFENGKIKKVNGKPQFTGAVRQERKAFVVIGLPAGGKSSVFANPLSYENGARIIDSDVVKPWLRGYDEGYGAGYVQNASALVANKAMMEAAKHGDNMVIPRIGGPSVISEVVIPLREMGYDVQLFYNDVSEASSIMRAASRFAEEGRYLSLQYLTGKRAKISKTFSTFAEKKLGDYYAEREQEATSKGSAGVSSVRVSDVLAGRGSSNQQIERAGGESGTGVHSVVQAAGQPGESGRGSESLSGGELIFSYAEWKSNDVAFGENPEEIWDSKSGKPMPTIKVKNNGVQSGQRLSGEPSSSGEGEREDRGAADGDRAGLGSEPNRAERSGSGRTIDNEVAVAQQQTQQPAKSKQESNKNLHNNQGERGKDYAPSSPKVRFNANVEAIRLMRQLMDDGVEAPTKEQMEVLRKYSGWGGLGTFFNDESSAENRLLHDVLSEEEYRDAVMSINSAYYTPATVIDALWDVAKQMGFKGGNVLEGSAGIGNIIGQMPSEISRSSNIEAVEIDAISGNILKLLYPDAKVHIQGFQDTVIRNGSVDLAITNVPFVTGLHVIDKADKDLSRKFKNIHDFCIAKNIRKLREGGIGIFITSSGTLDKSTALREWITDQGQADVVGAFRLHNKTFGGTNVTSDIIVVKKRVGGVKSENAIDISKASPMRTGEYEAGEAEYKRGQGWVKDIKSVSMVVNDFFHDHPEAMAGEIFFGFEKGDTYRPESYGLYPVEGKNQEKMLADWVKSIKEKVSEPAADATGTMTAEVNQLTGEKEGRMLVDDKGRLCVSERGVAVPLEINDQKVKGQTKQQCFKDYQAVQKAVDDVLQQQLNDPDDAALKPKLEALNRAFDLFVKRYGPLHKNTSISFLRNDIDFPSFQALEIYKEVKDIKGKVTVKTSKPKLFTERVIGFKTEPQPKTIKDAVIASLFRNNTIDVEWIAEKLDMKPDTVRQEVLNSRLGFEDPATGSLEIRYKYLSGNVREKLAIAEAYNDSEENKGRYDANVEELRKVVPMDIPAHLIDFSLGSSWIPMELYKQYMEEVYDLSNVQIAHIEGAWILNPLYRYHNEKNRAAGVYSEKFKETIYGHQLVAAALNNRPVKVAKQVSHGYGSSKITETIVDKEATQACAVRVDEIKDEFKQWAKKKMQEDEELAQLIEKIYNEKFNALVPMEVGDEFLPERFEGANTGISLRPHQKLGAIKGLIAPTMLAHQVGTGKSFTLITTAMEMRRLGTAKKPMIVVQNATVAQMTADAKLLYPNAKILSLSEKDRSAEGRRSFYAKIKYNDWDIIIVPQSTFERIPDSPERELQFIQEKIDEKKHVIEVAENSGMDSQELKRMQRELESLEQEYGDKFLVYDQANGGFKESKKKKEDAKKKEAALQNAATKAKEMLDRQVDDVQYFDDLGVDALLVDEAHEYKHLGFQTSIGRGIKGVDPSYSKKCAGLYNKTRCVFEKAGWRNVVFATGTPISNTAAEIWTFMKYLMPSDVMRQNDIYYFDDFVHNFGSISQMLEFTTSGKFKENTRFAAYLNKPELIRIWSQVADTVLSRDTEVKDEEPDLEGGKDQDMFLPQSPSLISIMAAVREELERFEKMSGKEKKENSSIPLTMYGIAKRAAIDPRLVNAEAPDEPLSKTNAAVKEILKDLKATESYKGTVAVFCDNQNRLGSNAAGKKAVEFNIYDDMRDKLIAQGVPAEQITIIKSGMSITAKQKIFDAVNAGSIRVVLGSTQTLGTGVNMQERLHLLIHMDAPDRPMDYTQRNGRIKRQGNLHKAWGKTIRVIRFGVEDSLDVTAYQRLKTKSGFIDSIMDGKGALLNNQVDRTVEEEEEGLFDNPVAVLSGSQYALKKNQAERELRKYRGKKSQWEADQVYVANTIRKDKGFIAANESEIQRSEKLVEHVRKLFPDGKVKAITIQGEKVDMTAADAADRLSSVMKEKVNDPVNALVKRNRENAIYNDVNVPVKILLDGHELNITVSIEREMVNDGGRMRTVIHQYSSYECKALGLETMLRSSERVRDILDYVLADEVTCKNELERIERLKDKNQHLRKEVDLLQGRVGMPFQFEKELADAEEKVDEYTELMKQEMAEKEAKYANAAVETVDLSKSEDSDDENLYSADEDWDEPLFREQEQFAEGQTFHIYKALNQSSNNVLGMRNTYWTELMPDEYATEQALLNAVRDQYPEYFVTIDGNNVRMESWHHVMGSVSEARQFKGKKGAESYILRKTRNAVNAVNYLAQQMGLDVEVLTSTEGLEGKDARAKGFFNPKTGKITLVLPNCANQSDLINTLLHEGVAHFGLRKMFGPHFATFLDNVYNNVSPEVKRRIDAAMKRNGWSRHLATEEYLARLAERTDFEHADRSGWWQKIKNFFMRMLTQAGIHLEEPLTDNELRYILWRSYDNLMHPDRRRSLFDVAKIVVMKQKLGIESYTSAPARQTAKAAEGALVSMNPLLEKWSELKKKHPHALLLFHMPDGSYRAVGDDIEAVGSAFGRNAWGNNNPNEYNIPADKLDLLLPRLVRQGHLVGITDAPADGVAREDDIRFYGNEETLNKDFDSMSSQDLLLSLSQKEGNERNETVKELVRRVRAGEARIVRMGQEVQLDGASDAQIAGTILGGWELGLSSQSDGTLRSVVPGGSEMEGRSSAKGKDTSTHNEPPIISWAKATGHYYDEKQVAKESLDKDVWQSGAESRVYRTADGKKVVKFMESWVYYKNPLLKHLDDIALHNASGFERLTILGYSVDEYGKLHIVIEQNLVEGVTVDEIFVDKTISKANDYINTYLENILGLVPHVDDDGNPYHMKYGILYKDIHGGNMIVDRDNNHHIIDCYVSRAEDDGRERAEGFSLEDAEQELYSLRTKEAPKKTGIGYKVFVLKNGQLYPPMVANPDGSGTPVGVWLDADAAPIAGTSKTGRPQVKAGGKGTQGGSGQLAYRPGWHLGTIPYALQFNRKDANGEKTLFPNNFVWAEVEYADDVNYQDEAYQEGVNTNGKYQHSLAGLKHVPTDGSYKYHTNPDPRTDEWIISGAMRVNRILSRDEEDEIVRKAGRDPQPVQDGDILTQDAVDAMNEEIAAMRQADDMGLLYNADEDWLDTDEDIARQIYEKAAASEALKFQEAWQDSMAGLKVLQNAIEKETGRKTSGAEDAYLYENRMKGKAKNQAEIFDRQHYRPLLKALNALMKDRNLSEDAVMKYLIAKHGLERNIFYAFKEAVTVQVEGNIEKEQKKLTRRYERGEVDAKEYKKLQQELRDRTGGDIQNILTLAFTDGEHIQNKSDYEHGHINYADYIHKEADLRRKYAPDFDSYLRDYSGLTELTGDEEEYEMEALDMVLAVEDSGSIKTTNLVRSLWNAINAATKESLRISYESGQLSRTQYNNIKQMFEYYVPLRGWAEDNADDAYDYVSERNVFSTAVKKTYGRKSVAENPIAYIANMAVSTILAGHRNLMKQHFLNYVMNNPTSLVSLSEQWWENKGTNTSPYWVEARPEIPAGASADEIADIVEAFNEDMQEKKNQGLAINQKGKLHIKYHATASEKDEHMVEVQRNGKTYQLYINGNPKAAQALNGTNSRSVTRITDVPGLGWIPSVTRMMAANFTSRNPAFIISNMCRDLNMAGASILIKESPAYNARFVANAAKVLCPRIGKAGSMGLMGLVGSKKGLTGLMPSLMRKYLAGELNTADETERYFKEFMEEGGETGFVNMLSVDSFKEKMTKELGRMQGTTFNPIKASKGTKEMHITKAFRMMGETFEFYNRCAEDASRFIVYMTSRQMGKTLEDSIADAKDVTLNFNRKGTGAMMNGVIRDLFIFTNPAIQALANMYKMAYKHPLKLTAVTAAFVAGGMLMPIINQWLLQMFGDDDDKDTYWNLPPWVRKNNLVMWIPGTKNFLTIPLAQEFRVFYGMGEMTSSLIYEHPVHNWPLEITSSFMDLVPINPTGNAGKLSIDLAPTVFQPLMQIGENTDFTGKPIWKENQGNKWAPMYTKAYASTPEWMVDLAHLVNDIGGNEGRKGWIENYAPFWGNYLNNPAVWNHLLQGYLGGIYNTVAKTFDVGVTAGKGEVPKVYQTPIINRFLNRPVERDNAGVLGEDYYSLIEERDKVLFEARTWKRKAAEGDEEAQKKLNDLMKSERYKRAEVIGHYDKIMKDLKAGERAIKEGAEHEENDMHDIRESMQLYKEGLLEELSSIGEVSDQLSTAIQKFDNAKSLAEKNKLRLRIERLTMQDVDGTPIGRSQDVEKALAYTQGKEVESKKTSDLYLKLATGQDIADDARIRAGKARIKQVTDKWKELKDSGRSEEAATYREQHADWFAAESVINSQQRGVAANKKLLNKGYDQQIMQLIKTQRDRMLEAIEGLE